MGDFDDMNATPLGKLPMPAVTSKADGPRIDGTASYNDLLKEMNSARAPPRAPEPARGADFGSLGGPQFQHMQQLGEPAPQPQYAPQQAQYAPQQQPQYAPQAPQARYARGSSKRRKVYDDDDDDDVPDVRRKGSFWGKLEKHKSSILVAVVTFAVLWYVAPKLAVMVPQLLTPTGKFNVAGLVVVAATIGGVHRVADHYVK